MKIIFGDKKTSFRPFGAYYFCYQGQGGFTPCYILTDFQSSVKSNFIKQGESMPVTKEFIEKVAADTGITIDKLPVAGLLALLQEKRRKIMIDKLEIFSRYDVVSLKELEKKIKDGKIPEHPAWEDLILLENLEASLALIDEDIKTLNILNILF